MNHQKILCGVLAVALAFTPLTPAFAGFGPAQGGGGGGGGSQTLAQVLGNGADANKVAITGLNSLTFGSLVDGSILGTNGGTNNPAELILGQTLANGGGATTLNGGDSNTGAGAVLTLNGASAGGGGGSAQLVAGSSGTGTGSGATLQAGRGGSAAGGLASVIGGNANGSNFAAGGVRIDTGALTGNASARISFSIAPGGNGTGSTSHPSAEALYFTTDSINRPSICSAGSKTIYMAPGGSTAWGFDTSEGLSSIEGAWYASTAANITGATSGNQAIQTISPTWNDGGTTSTTVTRTLYLNPTYNYTAASKTGTNADLQIDRVETSLATGAQYLARFRAGAAGTTDAFLVTNTGTAQAANFQATSNASFAFSSSTTVGGTSDTFISRSSANNFKFGNAIGDQTAGMFCGNINTGGNATTGIDIQSSASAKATFGSAAWIVFTNGTNGSGTADTGISRSAAGTVAIGTGAQGSTAGTLSLTSAILQSGGGLSFRGAAAGTDRITWGTGGTFASGTPEILGPSDQDLWITPATPGSAGAGRSIQLTGGTPNGANVGGDIRLTAGSAASGATGGQVVSLAGTGGSSNGNGGNSSFTAGTGGGAGGGGTCTMAGGAGGASGGPGGACTAQGGNGNSSGTDQAAGGLTLSSGLGTGQSTADIVAQTGYKLASGTTLQTAYDRLRVTSKTFTGSTTTATADLFLVASCAVSNSGIGVEVHYLIEVADGSNHVSSISGTMVVAASNRAGTVLATCTTAGTSNQQISDTTTFTSLAATTTATVSGTNVQLKVTPSWGAGTPNSVKITYQARAEGQTALTPQ